MTVLLEKAFKQATSLPELEQNRVAEWILDELKSEHKWDHSFATSSDMLASLADEALGENRAGKTKSIGLD